MTLTEVVQWLLTNKYAVLVSGELVLTGKLAKELNTQEAKPASKPKRTDLEAQYRQLWKDFVAEAEIPYTAMTHSGGNYYIRPYSLGGVIELIKILKRPDVDKQRLIESTKYYYATTAFKKTLLNYFKEGLWEEVYNNYLAGSTSGENPFER